MSKYLSKKQVIQIFNDNNLYIGKSDKIALRQFWDNLCYKLVMDGKISDKDYCTWDYPSFCKDDYLDCLD